MHFTVSHRNTRGLTTVRSTGTEELELALLPESIRISLAIYAAKHLLNGEFYKSHLHISNIGQQIATDKKNH
jgi:hypothetical protein